jgi:uncharacterized protein (TIGR02246 family)
MTSKEQEEKSVSTRTGVNRTPQQAADQNVEEMPSQDEREIRALIDQWAKAVRNGNRDGIRADHDSEILMFDVPPPLFSRGLDAYMATWNSFLSWSEKPVAFDFHDVEVTAGKDVAFATAIGHCAGRDAKGKPEALQFRLTVGLRKFDGRWRVTHEHHSLPAE